MQLMTGQGSNGVNPRQTLKRDILFLFLVVGACKTKSRTPRCRCEAEGLIFERLVNFMCGPRSVYACKYGVRNAITAVYGRELTLSNRARRDATHFVEYVDIAL
jgi:hypothetical protein